MPIEIVARSGILSACETSATRKLKLVDHGPSQLLRPAMVPNCLSRHSRTELGAPLSKLESPFRSVESEAALSVAGLKTKARSLLYPSPFTSPCAIGVNGLPDCTR